MTTAILTAGGTGSRMQNNIPKQFITVNEIPIIIYTLQKFQSSPSIDEIIIACVKNWRPILEAYCKEFSITKLQKIVEGGPTGVESIKNCYDSIENANQNDIILIHDGNRPLVDEDTIRRNIDSAIEQGSTTTYIDIHDGIIGVDQSLNIVNSELKREELKSTQTPHCFRYGVLEEIFSKISDPSSYISLADAATKLGYSLALVKGSEVNFKITSPNDLVLFEAIVNARQSSER